MLTQTIPGPPPAAGVVLAIGVLAFGVGIGEGAAVGLGDDCGAAVGGVAVFVGAGVVGADPFDEESANQICTP